MAEAQRYDSSDRDAKRTSIDLSNADSLSTIYEEDLFLPHQNNHNAVSRPRRSRQFHIAEIFLATLLLITNLAWYMDWHSLSRTLPSRLNYYGYPELQEVGFYHEWVNISQESVDEKWEGTFPSGGGAVSIPRAMALKHGIPPAVESTTRRGEMIYIIAGFHDMHCMDMIRIQLYEPYGLMSEPNEEQRTHILHCIEAVRQALHCSMDPTLINLRPDWPYVPDGQMHFCRNADALLKFAQEHHHPLPGSEEHLI